jgi:hypothetical protein
MGRLKKINDCKLTVKEMGEFVGGLSIEELIAAAWNSTPNGGSSTWTNLNDDCWGVLIGGEGPGVGIKLHIYSVFLVNPYLVNKGKTN